MNKCLRYILQQKTNALHCNFDFITVFTGTAAYRVLKENHSSSKNNFARLLARMLIQNVYTVSIILPFSLRLFKKKALYYKYNLCTCVLLRTCQFFLIKKFIHVLLSNGTNRNRIHFIRRTLSFIMESTIRILQIFLFGLTSLRHVHSEAVNITSGGERSASNKKEICQLSSANNSGIEILM